MSQRFLIRSIRYCFCKKAFLCGFFAYSVGVHRFFSYLMLALLWLYQKAISPILTFFGVKCRHYPTCSNYSKQAIKRFGPWPGGWMTLARLLRCHPIKFLGGTSGVDKVPKSITKAPLWAPWRYGHWRGVNTDE